MTFKVSLILFIYKISMISSIYSFSGEIVPYLDPMQCNISEYFNAYLLKCAPCKSSLHLLPTSNKLSCRCDPRSKIVNTDINGFPECEPCHNDEVPTSDQRNCIPCFQHEVKDNITTCGVCPADRLRIEREPNGTLLELVECVECSNNTEPSSDSQTCLPCSFNMVYTGGGNCTCPVKTHEFLDGVCIPRGSMLGSWPDDRNSYLVEYDNGQKIDSRFFRRHLRSSIYLCLNKNRTSCQILANMCTMVMFREDYKATPCKLFQDAKHIPTLESNTLPWLFYGEGDAQSVLSRKKIPTKYSLGARSQFNKLNFTAVRFYADGKFKSISSAPGSFLQICPGTWSSLDTALRIGIRYRSSCHIPAQQLLTQRETEFVDLFLQYWDGSESQLYAVPVLVLNMKSGRSQNNQGEDKSQWQLTRRFFFIDKISGVQYVSNQDDLNTAEDASVVRYLKSCTVRIMVQGQEEEGRIYPPLLVLKYAELTREEISQNVHVEVDFGVEYEMESTMKHAMEVSVGVLCGLAILWSGIQAWSHTRRSGVVGIDMLTMFKLVIFLCANIANAFFLVAMSASLHTFVFYKGQSVVQVLLPSKDEEEIVKTYIIVAFSLKIIEVLHLIWVQINIDIFFIDWERPRARNPPMKPRSVLTNTTPDSGEQPVSIWRTYFVANEWNELQTKRRVNVTVQLSVTVFFLLVVGVEHWATPDPEVHTSVPEYTAQSPPSLVCRVAAGGLVYMMVYFLQWMFVAMLYERYVKNCIQEFVDVCSMANISVFILSLENYGFYIHGRSAHGFADTDMQTIIEQLQREEDDLCGHRGLTAGNDQQTFQMSVPTQLRAYYRKVMSPISSIMQITKRLSMAGTGGLRSKMATGNVERSVQAYHTMNKFLAAFLEHALKDLDYDVREKAFLESLLDIEFAEDSERGVLYSDNGHSFDNILFYGNEFTLATFDLVLFLFLETVCQNFLLAAIVTAVVAKILAIIRKFGGRTNLAKKTLIDERFLI